MTSKSKQDDGTRPRAYWRSLSPRQYVADHMALRPEPGDLKWLEQRLTGELLERRPIGPDSRAFHPVTVEAMDLLMADYGIDPEGPLLRVLYELGTYGGSEFCVLRLSLYGELTYDIAEELVHQLSPSGRIRACTDRPVAESFVVAVVRDACLPSWNLARLFWGHPWAFDDEDGQTVLRELIPAALEYPKGYGVRGLPLPAKGFDRWYEAQLDALLEYAASEDPVPIPRKTIDSALAVAQKAGADLTGVWLPRLMSSPHPEVRALGLDISGGYQPRVWR